MSLLTTATNVVLHIKQKTDVQNIAVYDQAENQQILTALQFLDGSVQDDKKLMEHPKEDGTMIVDHVIDDPVKVTLQIIVSDDDSVSLNELNDLYKNCTPVIIKIKNELHDNLVMASKPMKADSSHYNKTVYDLTFKEIQEAVTLYVKMSVPQVKQKRNASKGNTGHKQPQSALKEGVGGIKGWWNKITGRG